MKLLKLLVLVCNSVLGDELARTWLLSLDQLWHRFLQRFAATPSATSPTAVGQRWPGATPRLEAAGAPTRNSLTQA